VFHADAERGKSRYKEFVPASLWMLILMTVMLAALLVTHLAVAWSAIRAEETKRVWKWLAIVPPLTPYAAWTAGKRVGPVLWVVLAVGYTIMRATSA
jgi:hypothetical protein